MGVQLLTKPSAPMKIDPGDNSKKALDKKGDEWVIYQIKLKKYIDRVCSPLMEQLLSTIKDLIRLRNKKIR